MADVPLPEPDWLHLKPFGYAPGHYMNRCRWCDKTVDDVDKMARCCRPCAEKLHAHAAAVSAAKDARIKLLEGALRHVNKCLSINDYGDYVLLSLFDAEIVRTALGDKT